MIYAALEKTQEGESLARRQIPIRKFHIAITVHTINSLHMMNETTFLLWRLAR